MFSAGHDLQRDRRRHRRGPRVAVRAVFANDADHSRPVAAGDCPGARPGHGGRLPVGGHLRSDRGGRGSQLRHARASRSACSAPRPAVALSRAVGQKMAMEMLLTAEPISAREAHRVGLVNRVVPRADLAADHARAGRTDRRCQPLHVGTRQAGVLRADRAVDRAGLSADRADHGRKRPRARRHRRHESIFRAPASRVGARALARLVRARKLVLNWNLVLAVHSPKGRPAAT